MSGIEVVSVAIGLVSAIANFSYLASRYNLIGPARAYRRQRFGLWPRILYYLFIFDADDVQELHRNINYWGAEDLRAWKNSYIGSCNAIAVAGAIFASIGLTALQLPTVSLIHWTVRAFFSASMLFGILSVVSATSQHRTIGLLNDPTALRLWLSRGEPSSDHRAGGLKAYPPPYDTLPLESSVSASLVTQFPRVLLNLAAFLYLVGFGLYLLFSWKENVPNDSTDYRNIFVVFVISMGLSVLHFSVCFVDRVTDAAKAAGDFNFQRLGTTLDSSAELQELEATLETFHQDKDLMTEVRKLTMEIVRLRQSLPTSPRAANN